MLDALIVADAAEPTAATLATLVEGVVAGHLQRVTLWAADADPDIAALAEAAGADFAGGTRPALGSLRAAHVLIVRGGVLLPPGWPQVVEAEARRIGLPRYGAVWRFGASALGARLTTALARTAGRVNVDPGFIAPRALLMADQFSRTGAVRQSVARARIRVECVRR